MILTLRCLRLVFSNSDFNVLSLKKKKPKVGHSQSRLGLIIRKNLP